MLLCVHLKFLQFKKALKEFSNPDSNKFKTIVVGALDNSQKTNTGTVCMCINIVAFIHVYNS